MFYKTYIVSSFANFVLDTYLSFRENKSIKSATSPPEIYKKDFTEDEFLSSKSYSTEKSDFGMIRDFIMFIISFIDFLYFAKQWYFCQFTSYEIINSIIYVIISHFIKVLVDMPFKYYSKFVIDQKYGFNNMTIKLWISDTIKAFLIEVGLISLVISVVIPIYRYTGRMFIIYCQLFTILFIIIASILYPIIILPLFNKLTPIEDGELKNKILKLAEESNFNSKQIFIQDDSKRTNHSNAMVFGLINKKIALADTLLKQATDDEICAIIGHEIGHSKHWHLFKMLIQSQVSTFIMLNLFYYIMDSDMAFKDFGFHDKHVLVGFTLTSLLLTPFNLILSLPLNLWMQSMELQADSFPAKKGLPIDTALIKLSKENKVAIESDWLYSAFNSSHPSTVLRVEKIREIQRKQN